MAGTIRKHGDGAWRLYIDAPRESNDGRRRQVTRVVYGTREEARSELARLIIEVDAGHWSGPQASFAELLDRFMAHARLEAQTRDDYDRVIRNHLKPALGRMSVHKLRAHHLDALYDRLGEKLAPARIHRVHTVARSALAQAVRWQWVATNPAMHASPPAVPHNDINPPSVEEVRRLAAAASAEVKFGLMVDLAVDSGARKGELCGLQWADLAVPTATVTIRRSVACPRGGGVVVKAPKNGKPRALAIDPELAAALEAHRKTVIEAYLSIGIPFAPDWFVFHQAGDPTKPWRTDYVSKRWQKVRSEVGLPHVRFHDLRHYVATQLLAAGMDPVSVAKRLGHAKPSTTTDLYAAWLPARDREASEILARLRRGVGVSAPR